MKRFFNGLLVAALLSSSICTARVEYEDEVDADKVFAEEQQQAERNRRKEEKRREREMKTHEKKAQSESKKEKKHKEHHPKIKHRDTSAQHEKKMKQDEKRALEKQKREERNRQMQQYKEERKQNYEYRRSEAGKHESSMQRKEDRGQQKTERKERREKRRMDHQASKMQRKEHERQEQERMQREFEQSITDEKANIQRREENKRTEIKTREQKIEQWKAVHAARVQQDADAGMFADLYKLPAWPTHALYYANKDLLNISADYQYASDCYDSNRSGSKSSITKLEFGEDTINFNEILLASKLVSNAKLVDTGELNDIQQLAKKEISFRGKEEINGLTISLGRYLFAHNVAVGVEIPVLYNHHKLNAVFDIPIDETKGTDDLYDKSRALLDRVLLAKGIHELGGSATGLGDVAFFINGQIDSLMFEKLVFGFRFQFPTGKKATTSKLWAPELGNGGFTEIQPFAAIAFNYHRYFNPHLLGQVSFVLPAHVDRRVPKLVTFTGGKNYNGSPGLEIGPDNALLKESLAMGDRVVVARPDGLGGIEAAADDNSGRLSIGFSEYDTTINGFGDTVSNIKMHKGPEIKLRVGNLIDQCLCQRGSLDLYYDFRVKAKDRVSGLPVDLFNLDILRKHTNALEHRIGATYNYQFDLYGRLHFGARYTFAGMNVPKAFNATCSLDYAF